MHFDILRCEYSEEDFSYVVEALSLPFTRVVNQSFIFAAGIPPSLPFLKIRDNASFGNVINADNIGRLLLPVLNVKSTINPKHQIPVDNQFWISSLDPQRFLQEINAILQLDTAVGLNIVIPCNVDEDYWLTVIIHIEKRGASACFYLEICILDTSHTITIDSSANSTIGQIKDLLFRANFSHIHDEDRYCYFNDGNWRKYKATGVFFAEQIATIITNHPFDPRQFEDKIDLLKRHQIECAFSSPFNVIDPENLRKNERPYTKLNFLGRNTTLTRSALLNVLLMRLEPLYLSGRLDFSHTIFVLVQHLLPQTVQLIKAMLYFGAKPENIFLLGKPYSTEVGVIEALKKISIHLIENNIASYRGGIEFTKVFNEEISTLWKQCALWINILSANSISELLILDDGSKAILRAVAILNHWKSDPNVSQEELELFRKIEEYHIPIIAVEQTNNGPDTYCTELLKYKKIPQKILPVIMMASSQAKEIVEAELIASQLIEKLNEVFEKQIIGKFSLSIIKIGIVGYGKIGSNVVKALIQYKPLLEQKLREVQKNSQKLSEQTIEIGIFETSCQLLATIPNIRELKKYATLSNLVQDSQLIIGCSGRDIFCDYTRDDSRIAQLLNNDKVFVSCSSGNIELFSLLKWLQQQQRNLNPPEKFNDNVEYIIGENKKITLVASGYPLNFSGYTPGVYFQNIQGTLGLLFGGLVQAHLLIEEQRAYFANLAAMPISSSAISENLFVYNWMLQREIVWLLFTLNDYFTDRISIEKLECMQQQHEVEMSSFFRYTSKDQNYAKLCFGITREILVLGACLSHIQQPSMIMPRINISLPPDQFISAPTTQDWNVPYLPEEGKVVPRNELLHTIDSALYESRKVALVDATQKGGVGKTFLALEIIRKFRQHADFNIFWFNAEQDILYFEYDRFCAEILGHQTYGIAEERLIQIVCSVIEQSNNNTLIIYDNAQNSTSLKRFLSNTTNTKVFILLTSRQTCWQQNGFREIAIPPLTFAEAVSFTSDEPIIAEMLGSFPLTLSLAITFLRETRITFIDYLQKITEQKHDIMISGDKHEYSLLAWRVSFNYLLEYPSLAIETRRLILPILFACAMLNPTAIPISILESFLKEYNNDQEIARREIIKILELLQNFALLRYEPGVIYMHRLVQENIRNYIVRNKIHEILPALQALLKVFYCGKPETVFIYYDNSAETLFRLSYLLPQLIVFLQALCKSFSTDQLSQLVIHPNATENRSIVTIIIELYSRIATFLNGTAKNESQAQEIFQQSFIIIQSLANSSHKILELTKDEHYLLARARGNRTNLCFTYLNSHQVIQAEPFARLSYFTLLEYKLVQCEKSIFGEDFFNMHQNVLYHDVSRIYAILFCRPQHILPPIAEQIRSIIEHNRALLSPTFDFKSVAHELNGETLGLTRDYLCENDAIRKRRWGNLFKFETYASIALLAFLLGDLTQATTTLQEMIILIPLIGQEIQDSNSEALVYLLLGKIKLEEGDTANLAIRYLRRSFMIYNELKLNEPMIALSAYCLAEAYSLKGLPQMAEFYFNKAQATFKFFGIFQPLGQRIQSMLTVVPNAVYTPSFYIDHFKKYYQTLFSNPEEEIRSIPAPTIAPSVPSI
ncbi:MAG: hypothetical protein A2X78_01920 [Gammaproteobacteria bacterium GWE2_37_16]|nr:MAG: hypothetical protein A2X78_01920 [Gammaproteobacteria bacterium GWE2_37_16]